MKKNYMTPVVKTVDLYEESEVMLAGSIDADSDKTTEEILSYKRLWGVNSIWTDEVNK